MEQQQQGKVKKKMMVTYKWAREIGCMCAYIIWGKRARRGTDDEQQQQGE
jgi:hypothetical protein